MDPSEEVNILVTGGLGYIGSHAVVELCETSRYKRIIIVDNLYNSSIKVLDRINDIITNKNTEIIFEEVDWLDLDAMDQRVFSVYAIHEVIHFAGYKAVGESVQKPLMYYENNLMSTINLLKLIEKYSGVWKSFVFSSSATVYKGESFEETSELGPWNPYGRTKFMIEMILHDFAHSNHSLFCVSLRYYNPIGAHPSGKIGERPQMPNNLMPIVQEVACGKREKLYVYGNDYDTIDGTGLRDYVHVVDLAQAHVEALNYARINSADISGEKYEVFNIGTGQATSVLQLINTFEETTGVTIPYEIVGRREGDVRYSWANTDKAKRALKWEAKKTIKDAWKDAWNWIKGNPDGVE